MIAAGYMAKAVSNKPEWIKASGVVDIYSLSNCVSPAFCDYIRHWKHNGYWLFNSPSAIREIAAAQNIDLSNHALFYYEVYEQQFDEQLKLWPENKELQGYDVVSFVVQTSPECSPLACNALAESIPVNRHCLLGSFDEAKDLLERGAFDDSEPGPFRIFAVYSCPAAR
jgi:hypothetical protein